MTAVSRRQFLASTTAISAIGALPSLMPLGSRVLAAEAGSVVLRAESRMIEVAGKPAKVFGLTQPGGTHGLHATAGQRFRVRLENRIGEETLIHWHGLTPPYQQDGVPFISQPPLSPNQDYSYDFPLTRPGTNWMHSHHGLQEQRLMAAPLIVQDPAEAAADAQEVIVILHDFTFRDPGEILAELKGGKAGVEDVSHAGHGAPAPTPSAAHAGMQRDSESPSQPADHGATGAGSTPPMAHLHDVEYDAFLANDRALADPAVFRVEEGGRVRLRLVNAATTTNFWIDLDRLEGTLIAVDGMPVQPLPARRLEFAIAQRFDILLTLPRGPGSYPIFAVREGDTKRTGFVLATKAARVSRLSSEAGQKAEPVGLALERRLLAAKPLPLRPADRRLTIVSTEESGYVWKLNGATFATHRPLAVRQGERVEITFEDRTTMAHPMHLHGHHFQVVAINGERFSGAVRDTVLVPARGRVTIAFDADNPGRWALHCHNLYHMAAGMMTTVEYET